MWLLWVRAVRARRLCFTYWLASLSLLLAKSWWLDLTWLLPRLRSGRSIVSARWRWCSSSVSCCLSSRLARTFALPLRIRSEVPRDGYVEQILNAVGMDDPGAQGVFADVCMSEPESLAAPTRTAVSHHPRLAIRGNPTSPSRHRCRVADDKTACRSRIVHNRHHRRAWRHRRRHGRRNRLRARQRLSLTELLAALNPCGTNTHRRNTLSSSHNNLRLSRLSSISTQNPRLIPRSGTSVREL